MSVTIAIHMFLASIGGSISVAFVACIAIAFLTLTIRFNR